MSPVKTNKSKVLTKPHQPEPTSSRASEDKGIKVRSNKTDKYNRRLNRKDKPAEISSINQADADVDVYGELDGSRSLLLHGLQSDFIEEQMAEDKEFRFL